MCEKKNQICSYFSEKHIYVLHQNIAGLLNKLDLLLVNLEELKDADKSVDVICVTEHFMMEGYECNLVLPNYTLASSHCRSCIKRGGTCILLKQEHKFRELPEIKKFCLDYIFECCAVELLEFRTAVICIYRVPKQNNLYTFFERLEKTFVLCS